MKIGSDRILVTGARGQQGGAVTRRLISCGHNVAGMTRQPESEGGKALAALGAEVVYGDFDDVDSLRRAFEGAWGIFSMQNTWEAGVEREEEQGKKIVEVAKEVGVQHFVYTSVGSAHRDTGIPHFDNKWRIEEALRGAGLPSYTIIRPVFFMENFVSPWFKPAIDEGKLMVGIQPDTALQMVAVNDIGMFGCMAFEQHEELNGAAIDIAGDEMTMPEAAKIISDASGRTVSFEQVPIEEVRQFSEDFALMLEWFDRVGYEADIAGLPDKYGIRPLTFAEWARETDW